MGYLKDFVLDKMNREHEDRTNQVNAWHLLATDPRADDPTKQYAMEQLLGMHKEAGKHVKDGGPQGAIAGVLGKLGTLIGMKRQQDAGGAGTGAPMMMPGDMPPPAPANGQPGMRVNLPEGYTPAAPFQPHFLSAEELAQRDARVSGIKGAQDTANEVQRRRSIDPLDVQKTTDTARAGIPVEVEKAQAMLPVKMQEAREQNALKGEFDDIEFGRRWARVDNMTNQLVQRGQKFDEAFQNAMEANFPGYTRPSTANLPGGNSVEAMEMRAWLAKNPGKTEADWYDYKQKFPTERIVLAQGYTNDRFGKTQDMQLANQFNQNPITQRFSKVAEGLQFIQGMDPAGKLTSADNIGLLYAFAKAMDPDSVVREGEYATVQKYAQSWLQQFGMNVNRILSNEEFLTDEAVANMKSTILQRARATFSQYNALRNTFIQRARNQGIENPDTYIPDYTLGTTGLSVPTPGPGGGGGGTVVMVGPDGKQWNVPEANIPMFESNGYKKRQ